MAKLWGDEKIEAAINRRAKGSNTLFAGSVREAMRRMRDDYEAALAAPPGDVPEAVRKALEAALNLCDREIRTGESSLRQIADVRKLVYDALRATPAPQPVAPTPDWTQAPDHLANDYGTSVEYDSIAITMAHDNRAMATMQWPEDGHEYAICRRPQKAQPLALDAPDEVDCDYWFDGVAVHRGDIVDLQDSVRVRTNSIDGGQYAHISGFGFEVKKMRGKWYKRDKAPWQKAP